jgi:hypothetical protein
MPALAAGNMTRANETRLDRGLAALDAALLDAPRWLKCVAIGATILVVVLMSLSNVPRSYVDYSGLPLLHRFPQPDTYGTDSLSDMYGAKVILNDVWDMYTRARLEQTPLEAATWTKEESAPYPPVVLLVEAGLYRLGEWTGIGFYGLILAIAMVFLASSLIYFLRTRWYLFPLLYLNFSYFSYRFVQVQDSTYLVMLMVVMAALWLGRWGRDSCHLLMALATTMKLSPLYYVKNITTMTRGMAAAFVAILAAGLVAPYFVWDNYLYIYRYGSELKGDWQSVLASLAFVVPFSLVLWYVERRRGFDLEDRIGWGLVPFAMFLGLTMNVARHLLIVLLVPDKRAIRNVAAAVGLLVPALLPSLVPFNSALLISTAVLCLGLWHFLSEIGWDAVRADLRHPRKTARMMLEGP